MNTEDLKPLSHLHAAIEATAEGILVVDREGKISFYNRKFLELWNIPESLAELRDDNKLLEFVLDQLKSPETFIELVRNLYNNPEQESTDILEFKDGRVYERFSKPQRIADVTVGRVWSFRNITESKKKEEAIHESEKRYKRLIESVTDYIYTVHVRNNSPVKTSHGPGCISVTGYTTEDYDADPYLWYRMIYEEDRKAVIEYAETSLRGEVRPSLVHRIIHKNGSIRWVANTIVLRFDEKHQLIAYDGLIKDITERRQIEEQLKISEAKYRSLVDSTDDSIYLVDRKCRYLFMNEKHVKRWGLSKDYILGKLYADFHPPEDSKEFSEIVESVFRTGESIQFEHQSHKDNRYFIRTFSPVKSPKGKVTAVTIVSKDITQLKVMEEKLHALSITDELTGLYNRRGFLFLAEQQLKLADRERKGIFMLYADMNKLKVINDDFGHKEGDNAIIEISRILKSTYRSSDVIARIGGDEFVVIPVAHSREDVDLIVARLQDNLERYNLERKSAYKLSLSAGISFYDPENPCSIDELLREADKMMYEQKKRTY
jgi:diguanylate cyclase (GGDEF)-like protein/PAS domain S-box-containing protein